MRQSELLRVGLLSTLAMGFGGASGGGMSFYGSGTIQYIGFICPDQPSARVRRSRRYRNAKRKKLLAWKGAR